MQIPKIDYSKIRTLQLSLIVVIIWVFVPHFAHAQNSNTHNSSNAIILKLDYGYHFPTGVLSERFGSNFVFGLNAEYLFRNSFFIGATYDVIFSNNVKEDVLSSIRTSNGNVLSTDFDYAQVFLRERGAFLGLTFGKIFPTNPNNNKTGIRIVLSPGVFKHNVRLNDENRNTPHINNEYIQGYDRKTGGFGVKTFVGYQLMTKSRRMNFVFGVESIHGFTKSLRPIDYNTQSSSNESRFDQLYGFRLSWMLPFYSDERPEEEIFY